jgi:hypothetical protein
MGQFAHTPVYADTGSRAVVRPSADTLHRYDMDTEPLVRPLPDTGDRYHVVPVMDMWTDVFAMLGMRSNGNGGGVFAIVAPPIWATSSFAPRPMAPPTVPTSTWSRPAWQQCLPRPGIKRWQLSKT